MYSSQSSQDVSESEDDSSSKKEKSESGQIHQAPQTYNVQEIPTCCFTRNTHVAYISFVS